MNAFDKAADFSAVSLQALVVTLVLVCIVMWGALNIKGHMALFQDDKITGLELLNATLKVCALIICVIGFFVFAGL